MQVAKNKVISIDYKLTDAQGTELDSSHGRGPFAYIHGVGNIIPGLEAALEGKSKGDQVNAEIPPEKAYGTRDENLVQNLSRSQHHLLPRRYPFHHPLHRHLVAFQR